MARQHGYTAPQVRQLLWGLWWCHHDVMVIILYLGVVVFLTVPFFFLQAAHCCTHIAGLMAQYLKIKGIPLLLPSLPLTLLPSFLPSPLTSSIAVQKWCKTYKYLVQIAEMFSLKELIQKSEWTKQLQWVHVYVATFVQDLISPCENTILCLSLSTTWNTLRGMKWWLKSSNYCSRSTRNTENSR